MRMNHVFLVIKLIVERVDCYLETKKNISAAQTSICQGVYEVTLGITDFHTTSDQVVM
jgi:hypothetical protein